MEEGYVLQQSWYQVTTCILQLPSKTTPVDCTTNRFGSGILGRQAPSYFLYDSHKPEALQFTLSECLGCIERLRMYVLLKNVSLTTLFTNPQKSSKHRFQYKFGSHSTI